MYTKYYLQARDAADKIREGQFQVPTTEEPSEGFVPRRNRPSIPERLEASRPNPQQTVVGYMGDLQTNLQQPFINEPIVFEGDEGTALNALRAIESSHNYHAVGPVVKSGMFAGQRALGAYQVMEGNVGPWTEEVLGTRMTPEEFLANKNAQDAVAKAKMRQSFEKYGSWDDAASVWFSGRPLAKAGNASDGYNTVPQYVNKFRNAMRRST
jgi:hypothetical protein